MQVQNPVNAQVGDRVELRTPTRRYYQALLVLYGLPPLFLLAGALLGQTLGGGLPGDTNVWATLGGMGLFVLSLFGIRRATSRVDEAAYRPAIERILRPKRS